MKGFIVVSLICFFGAVSAAPANELALDVCRDQAYVEVVNCTKHGNDNSTSEAQCISNGLLEYYNCIEKSHSGLDQWSADPKVIIKSILKIINGTIEQATCLYKVMVETFKCNINGHLRFGHHTANREILEKCVRMNIPGALKCF